MQHQPTASCLRPSGESREPGLVYEWLFVILAGHTPMRNSPLSLRLDVGFSGCVVCLTAPADILTKTGGFFVFFFLVVTKRRVLLIPPAITSAKHRDTQTTVGYYEYLQLF